MSSNVVGIEILIRGIVQGVGFRPYVYRLAIQHGLTGWVKNSSRGVEILANGPSSALDAFVDSLKNQAPPLARIDLLETRSIQPDGFTGFTIQESLPQPGEFIPVSPDVSICPDCTRELFDPQDRRYRYPFINCTNCGPRFSIIQEIPYDRPNTTMAAFPMCPDCQAEYDDPADRRFHAQPVACPVCGPQIWFEAGGQHLADREAGLQLAREWLQDGKILAIKGLGGYHLACDASNPVAVDELRRRKQRSDKPFALMVFSIEILRKHCIISPQEVDLLSSRQRPIVLLKRLPQSSIVPQVAPGQSTLGVMLPYTPLHLLLMEPGQGFPEVLVMTSGNLSEEPIAYEDADALQRLNSMADAFLLHDRPIYMRVDDSVQRISAGSTRFMRRSRGFIPDPIQVPENLPQILAAGAELKNTFCLSRQRYAFVSHHIGDLENYETLRSYETGIKHFEKLFKIQPEILACDLHPNYLSTRYAQERAQQEGLPLIQVQHHHAHLAACLAENGLSVDEPAIGLSFDGTGYGTDGAIWGGEVLVGDYRGFERVHHLSYSPLPGGDAAIRHPNRMALSHLWRLGIEWESDLPPVQSVSPEDLAVLHSILEHKLNSPPTSSMGRLFDAVSALLGVRQVVNYEGQAAMELEALSQPDETGFYQFKRTAGEFDPAPLFADLIKDWRSGVPIPRLAARFHNSLTELSINLCAEIRSTSDINRVALSGGVWQNRFLFERTCQKLIKSGFEVLTHRQLPPNDGCISLGQTLVAAYAAPQAVH